MWTQVYDDRPTMMLTRMYPIASIFHCQQSDLAREVLSLRTQLADTRASAASCPTHIQVREMVMGSTSIQREIAGIKDGIEEIKTEVEKKVRDRGRGRTRDDAYACMCITL